MSEDAAIAGVELVQPPTFADERGMVYRMVRTTDPHFRGFGEIYFSTVYPGVVKAWKKHRRLTATYACITGRIRMVLCDARMDSPTSGRVSEIMMGPDEYRVLVVPPDIWNGFQGLGVPLSIVANCASEPYDPAEFDRVAPSSPEIPYRWPSPIGEAVPHE